PLQLGDLTAVVGDATDVDDWLRGALVRLAVTHSPNDVRILAVLGPQRAGLESWLRWLPHAAPLAGGIASVAIGAGDGHALLEELTRTEGGTERLGCVVDSGAGLTRRVVEGAAAPAADRRLHLLWLGDDLGQVPAATASAVDLAEVEIGRAHV